jgi:hypothetical protein
MQMKRSQGRCRSRRSPRRAEDRHQQSFQDNASSRKENDAIDAIVARPTWSRFSPGKLAGRKEKDRKMTPSRR